MESAQAGQSITCPCGRRVEVPSMLELRKLPVAPTDAPPSPQGRWGIRQRLISLGGLIVLAALVWIGVLVLQWPEKPQVPDPITWQTPPLPGQKEPLRKTTEQLTLLESYLAWESLPRQLDLLSDAPMTRYKRQLAAARNWLTVGVIIGILGLVCGGSAWLIAPQSAGRRPLRPDKPGR